MGILMGILMVIFVIVCLLLIFIILLQSSKGDSLASGIFGGAGMQNVFGGRGAADFLSKLTTGLAISFIVLSLILAKFYGPTGSTPELKSKEAAETQISEKTEKANKVQKATKDAAPAGTKTEKSAQQTDSEKDKTE